MISYTTFVSLIYVIYAWFAIGVGIISVFSIRELFLMFRKTNDHGTVIEGVKSYEM